MVSAPRSGSNVAIDRTLYNDMWAKSARQDLLETLRTLTVLAVKNEPKFRRITRITQCMVSLSKLADVCDAASRSDIPTPCPSNTGETKNQDTTTGAVDAHAPRRSARIAANTERRQRQSPSSSLADDPHHEVAPSNVTQSTVPRKRKRTTKTSTSKATKEERKVASHARAGDRKDVKPVARCPLGPRSV